MKQYLGLQSSLTTCCSQNLSLTPLVTLCSSMLFPFVYSISPSIYSVWSPQVLSFVSHSQFFYIWREATCLIVHLSIHLPTWLHESTLKVGTVKIKGCLHEVPKWWAGWSLQYVKDPFPKADLEFVASPSLQARAWSCILNLILSQNQMPPRNFTPSCHDCPPRTLNGKLTFLIWNLKILSSLPVEI